MRFLLRLVVLTLSSLFLLASSCQSDKAEKATNDVIVQTLGMPLSLHPTNSITIGSSVVINYFISQTLLRTDPKSKDLSPIPLLAKSLPTVSADNLIYFFELDPDAKWNDGAPIVAKDVLFSIKAVLGPLNRSKTAQVYFRQLKAVHIDSQNPRKFDLEMKELYTGNPYIMESVPIIDKRVFDPKNLLSGFTISQLTDSAKVVSKDPKIQEWSKEFNDQKYDRNPEYLVGISGPYKVEEWVPGQKIVLARNENYWGAGKAQPFHKQYPDHIVFKKVVDENSVELMLKQTKFDVVAQVRTALMKRYKENDSIRANYQFFHQLRNGYTCLVHNTQADPSKHNPAIHEKLVRQAIASIIPTQEIINEVYEGRAYPVNSPVWNITQDYNQNLKLWPYSIEVAQQKLDEAGWVDQDGDIVRDKIINGTRVALELKIIYPHGRQGLESAISLMVASAKKAGIKLIPTPVQKISTNLLARDFEIYFGGFTFSSNPYDYTQLWSCKEVSSGYNFSGFCNSELEALIPKIKTQLNPKLRKPMTDRAQEIIQEEQPFTFLYNYSNNLAIHEKWDNVIISPSKPNLLYNNLKLKE